MGTRRSRLVILLLPLLVGLVGLLTRPAPALAQSDPACYVAAQEALSKIGATYSQGGHLASDPVDSAGVSLPRTGPDSFDCSGLVKWAYEQAGVDVGWTTAQQVNEGQRINCTLFDLNGASTTCWAPGDLAFLQYNGGQHVSIYVGDGLFADAYNGSTGVMLHDVSQDSFYQSHFWQSRRITSGCEDMTIEPGTPSAAPSGVPPLEYPRYDQMPDLLGYVVWRIPQCEDCAEDGQSQFIRIPDPSEAPDLPKPEDWTSTYRYENRITGWTFDFELMTPTRGAAMIFNWLVWHIHRIILILICWLFVLVQWIVTILQYLANVFIAMLNAFWKFALFAWLTIRQWIYVFWSWLEATRTFFVWLNQAIAYIWAWLVAIWDVFMVVLRMFGQLLMLLLNIAMAILGLLGWVAGLGIGMILSILAAIQSTALPTELNHEHGVYYIMRGILDALHDSPLKWVLWLLYGMCYVSFIVWMARFLPSARED
jgi:hypothetical protein